MRHAALKIKGGKFIGIDPVPRMVEIAIEETKEHMAINQIEFRVGSAENHIADYVLAFDSIDHWQDIEKGLLEVKRIMQLKGKFIIVKDNSVPGAKKAIADLTNKLDSIEFVIVDKQTISNDEVGFYMIIVELGK